jgi:hypothetical protein
MPGTITRLHHDKIPESFKAIYRAWYEQRQSSGKLCGKVVPSGSILSAPTAPATADSDYERRLALYGLNWAWMDGTWRQVWAEFHPDDAAAYEQQRQQQRRKVVP